VYWYVDARSGEHERNDITAHNRYRRIGWLLSMLG
jgi:hypothetical protein